MNKRKLLLASCISNVIAKLSFVFPKPPSDLVIVCITTAANVYQERSWQAEEMQAFTALGFNLIKFDIAGKNQQAVAEKLCGADVIYVTGGNSYYLMEKMQKCGFAEIAQDRMNHGALYIGSSAGAVVTCPSIDYIRNMDDPAVAQLDNFAGLHLIDFKILPHIDHPKYGPQTQVIAAEIQSTEPVLCLRDDQAVLITDNVIKFF